jgi:PAS domain S-box-containing protein
VLRSGWVRRKKYYLWIKFRALSWLRRLLIDGADMMRTFPLPANELQRLKALYQYMILDTAPEERFDRVTRLCQKLLGCPIAAISLVDTDRVWHKSAIGFEICAVPREDSFCSYTILGEEVLEVEDARCDERFADYPTVSGSPNVIFYAGAPLFTAEGFAMGALCVVDHKPRRLSAEQRRILVDFASWVADLIRLGRALRDSRALVENQTLLHSLFDMAPVGIALLDPVGGRFLEGNPELRAMLGYSAEEVRSLNIKAITPESFHQAEENLEQPRETGGRCGPYESQLTCKSGRLLDVSINKVGVRDITGNNLIWAIVRDVSQTKELERIKNELIAVVSHELRTPLTSITGALGLIKRRLSREGGSGRYGELFDIAYNNCFRLNMLVNDLLDIEKLMAGKMAFRIEILSLADLLQQTLQENKSYADQYSVRLQLEPLLENFYVAVDGLRFQQILSNLISNAVKFSPPNATVEIAARRQGDSARITVKDWGSGIPLEYQNRVFQKFSQADPSPGTKKEGTGLGLAISRELVERMDGAIGFESVSDQGTTFFITLPLRQSSC